LSSRGISTIGRTGVAALVALGFVLLALPAAASAADGSISGKVTFESGGAAVAGAEVCAEEAGEIDFGCAPSGSDGTYLIGGLAPGSYVVSVEATDASPYAVFKRRLGTVTVNSEATTTGIDVVVIKGGAVTGTVTDATTGLPIDEVEVSALWTAENEYDGFYLTDSNGSFKLLGLNPGPHEIEFWAWDGDYETRFVNLPVAAGATINANAFLVRRPPPEGRIGGHVYAAATQQPIAGVAVCAIDGFGESRGCAHTSKAGAYEFIQVPAGPWRIAFSPTPVEFEPFEPGELSIDPWPTQFWNMKPTLAQADVINLPQAGVVAGIDGLLGPGPQAPPSGGSSTPNGTTPPPPKPVAVTPAPKPKPLACGKGKVKRRVKGKQRCVKRHKPRRHQKKHRPQR